jgi:thiamine-phosphate pyrophosphorylase
MSPVIIDANLNRAREGLRVLEEIARFILQNKELSFSFKNFRLRLPVKQPIRDVPRDPGALSFLKEKRNLLEILNANAARVQEALRVLAEFSENSSFFETLRFESYQLHQNLFYQLERQLRLNCLRGLYLICDTDVHSISIEKITAFVTAAKISVLQFRSKQNSKKAMAIVLKKLREHLKKEALIIVNDHLDLALAFGDGVHLGQTDFPINEARKLVPASFIIGASANTVLEGLEAENAGANYLGAGCLFSSTTKHNTRPLNIETLGEIIQAVNIPVCAIGGINLSNISAIMPINPDMIAVGSAVWKATSPLEVANKIQQYYVHPHSTSAALTDSKL